MFKLSIITVFILSSSILYGCNGSKERSDTDTASDLPFAAVSGFWSESNIRFFDIDSQGDMDLYILKISNLGREEGCYCVETTSIVLSENGALQTEIDGKTYTMTLSDENLELSSQIDSVQLYSERDIVVNDLPMCNISCNDSLVVEVNMEGSLSSTATTISKLTQHGGLSMLGNVSIWVLVVTPKLNVK